MDAVVRHLDVLLTEREWHLQITAPISMYTTFFSLKESLTEDTEIAQAHRFQFLAGQGDIPVKISG